MHVIDCCFTTVSLYFLVDIEDLVYVNACMVDLADDWVRLGECLRVTEAKLSIIRAQNPDHDVTKCLLEMLAEWLNNDFEPMWERIVIAIAGVVGDESATQVAKRLQSEYACMIIIMIV